MKVNKKTCPWFLLILFWNQKDAEVVLANDEDQLKDFAKQFDDPEALETALPINGKIGVPLQIYKIPEAGKIKGPTQVSIIQRFGRLLPKSKSNIKFTNLSI